jgi:hypothetical protein
VTKAQALGLLNLLSALESWSFSLKERLPDYLHEDIQSNMEILEKIVLSEKKDG